MPHLHLPADHTDLDVALAANVAARVDSDELWVTWTHGSGAGAVPSVEAELREEPAAPPAAGPLVELFAVLAASFVAIWHAFAGTPREPAPSPARQRA